MHQCLNKGKLIVIHVFAGIAMAIAFGVIFGYFVMQLWNHLIPELFGLQVITFWQGAGLVILCRLLFGTRSYHPVHRRQGKKVQNVKNQELYRIWWQKEGKEAFEKYIVQKSSN
jgi:hypothetical protein